MQKLTLKIEKIMVIKNYHMQSCEPSKGINSWFFLVNTQCYYSLSKETYDSIIKNNYPPEKIVMGMESGQFDKSTFKNAIQNVNEIKNKYPTFAGVYDWEYLNAPPDTKDPSQWAKLMKNI